MMKFIRRSTVAVAFLLLYTGLANAQFVTPIGPSCTPSISATASQCVQRDSNANIFVNNYFANAASTVSASGTTTLTAASARYQRLSGSLSQNFDLPNATTLPLGPAFVFNNDSSGSLVVRNAGSSTQFTVPAGGIAQFGPTDISTANGVWTWHSFVPSTVSWGSGTTGLQINTALTTSAYISGGAASATSPVFAPQRGAPTYGLGGSGTTVDLIAGGASILSVSTTAITGTQALTLSPSFSASSGSTGPTLSLSSTVNNSGTSGFTGLSIAPTLTGLGSGTNLLANITGGAAALSGQLRLGYDASNYLNFLIASNGNSTLSTGGASGNITLNSVNGVLNLQTGSATRFVVSGDSFAANNASGPQITNSAAGSGTGFRPNRTAANASISASAAGNVTTYASNGTGGAAVNVLDAAYTGVSIMGGTLGSNALSVAGTSLFSGGVTLTSAVGIGGQVSQTFNGSSGTSVLQFTGTTLTGAGTTNTLPRILAQPTGTTAVTTWSDNGTFIGANLASGLAGNFLDFHVAGAASVFSVSSSGAIAIGNTDHSISLASLDRTVTIVINGTTYYLAAKTTND